MAKRIESLLSSWS